MLGRWSITPLSVLARKPGMMHHCCKAWRCPRCLQNRPRQPGGNGGSANEALLRHTGRPTREESGEIPPKVRAALTLRAAGHSWKQCSDMTGASYRNLLKWKDQPIAEAYVEEKVKEALAGN